MLCDITDDLITSRTANLGKHQSLIYVHMIKLSDWLDKCKQSQNLCNDSCPIREIHKFEIM